MHSLGAIELVVGQVKLDQASVRRVELGLLLRGFRV